MQFPAYRARRLRRRAGTRALVRETDLRSDHMVGVVRVCAGKGVARASDAVAAPSEYSVDRIEQPLRELDQLGVRCVLLAPIGDQRDELAKYAARSDGVLARAISRAREVAPELTVLAELDPASFTQDGQSGLVQHGLVDNDATLDLLAEMALVCARAGADFVVPSASMDGQVGWLREALDEEDQEQVGIVPCSARYASAYAAARPSDAGAARVARAHLLGPGNVREAIREATLDVEEGADMLMVRPAAHFLDVITRLSEELDLPLLGYIDEGEHAVIEAAARAGVVQREDALAECVLAVRRAGADAVVTPFAADVARVLAR